MEIIKPKPTAFSTDLRQQVAEFVLELAENIGEASKGKPLSWKTRGKYPRQLWAEDRRS